MRIATLTAVAAWAAGALAYAVPPSADALAGSCPITAEVNDFGKKLSWSGKIYFPGSAGFKRASTRWSNLEVPKPWVVVVPGTENDVALTVKFANLFNVPFLAYNSAHGAITTLGRMNGGIEIFLEQLSSVKIARDGKTAEIGGGTGSKLVTDTLWAAGKQAVTGTCECVSYFGPALGGGHGWLQGHHGLISDQWVSLRVVLADGSIRTIDKNSDLWYAMQGAGHNFGIVTSGKINIFDIQHRDWAVETLIFSGDKVAEVYDAANKHILKGGNQAIDVINWSYWLNDAAADPNNPIILFWILQEGVKKVDPVYSKPFYDIGPLIADPVAGDYNDLAAWTGIALDSPPCQKEGLINPRFPLYLKEYNVPAMVEAYDLFAANVGADSPFSHSLFMFEGYSNAGLREGKDATKSAFAFRDDNLLTAPLITYTPGGDALNKRAEKLGSDLRRILHKASGEKVMHTYVNYAYGNEGPKEWYGAEKWRQDKLKALKKKYDPRGRFSFYAPVA